MKDTACAHIASSGFSMSWDTTLLVGLFTILVTAILFYFGNRIQAKSKLDDVLNNLLNLGIQYPNLERSEFISSITDYEKDEESMRYNLYCIAWFNFLHQLYKFHSCNARKAQNDFNCDEVVTTHQKWWSANFKDNYEGYSADFVKYIQSIIK